MPREGLRYEAHPLRMSCPGHSFGAVLPARSQSGGELCFVLRSEPKTFNPMLVEDDSSEPIRYLTGGVLIRVNRKTQVLEPELAQAWKVSGGGKEISFPLAATAYPSPTGLPSNPSGHRCG